MLVHGGAPGRLSNWFFSAPNLAWCLHCEAAHARNPVPTGRPPVCGPDCRGEHPL